MKVSFLLLLFVLAASGRVIDDDDGPHCNSGWSYEFGKVAYGYHLGDGLATAAAVFRYSCDGPKPPRGNFLT